LFVAAGRQAPVLELGEETIIRRTTGLALGVVLATAVAAGWTSPAPAAEKILRLGTYGLPAGQGNPHTSTSRPTIWWWLPLYDNATYMDEKGDPGPGLALSWHAEGKDTWVFELRPNVRFHNGRPFYAQAFADVVNFMTSENGRTFQVFNEIRTLGAARATGPLTVEIKTTEPDPIVHKKLGALRVVEPKA
jgi:peptide/nickel transport system substrate-binding protein